MNEVLELVGVVKELEQGLLEIARKLGEIATEMWELYKTQ